MAISAPDYTQIYEDAGREWDVHPLLLQALAGQEGGGTSNVSPAGAQGHMQIMPRTQKYLGVTDPNDVRQSIFGGARYLSEQIDKYKSPALAMAAYNVGPGRVDDYLSGKSSLPLETLNYVPGVTKRYQALMAAKGQNVNGTDPVMKALGMPGEPASAPNIAPLAAKQSDVDPFTAAQGAASDPFTQSLTVQSSQQSAPSATDPFTDALGRSTEMAGPPAPEPSIGSKIGAGLVRAAHDITDKPAEWLARGADALGLTSGQGGQVVDANTAGRQNYNDLYGDSAIASGARLGGQLAGTIPMLMSGGALLGAGGRLAAAGAGSVSPAAGAAVANSASFLGGSAGGAGMGGLALRGASLATNGAMNGAAAGAMTAGQSNESVGQQMAQGAGVGALAGPLIGAAASGVRGTFNALTGMGGGASPEVARLGQLARDTYGIPITAPQLSGSSVVRIANEQSSKLPFSGAAGVAEGQQTAFNRAVANTFGETTDRITSDVMDRAARRIGGDLNAVAARTTIQADPPFLTSLMNVGNDARQVLTAQEMHPITTQIGNLVDAAQRGNGGISGDAYQALTRAGSPLSQAMKSANPNVSHYAGQVREALDNAFARSAAPADQQMLGQARGQWRAMKTVEDLVEKSADGTLSPALLMGQVRSASSRFDGSTGGMAYTGGGALGDLARIGQQFLKPQPNSGTADRMLVNGMLLGGQSTMGGLAAAGMTNPLALAGIPAGLAANRLLGSYVRSGGLANRVINSSLNPAQNPLVGAAGQALPYAAPVGAIEFNSLNPDARARLMNPLAGR